MEETSRGGGSETIEVVDNPDSRYYELKVDGVTAGVLVYETTPGARRVLTHTTVREEFRGRGLSKPLIKGALDDLAARGATITNHCPAVTHFLGTHPEYERLLDPEHPGSRPEHG